MDLQVDEKPKKLPGSDKLASMCVWKHTAFNYLDTPQVTTARTWPEVMDLLASETARLVLSYTLDQHLPATSKQLVSILLMTLLKCHPLGNLSSIDKTFNSSHLRCPSAGTLPSWPTCPQLSCEEPPGLAAGASKMSSESFRFHEQPLFFLLNSSLIIRTLLTPSQK